MSKRILIVTILVICSAAAVRGETNPRETAKQIDKLLAGDLQLTEPVSRLVADDQAFVKRVYLDIVGRLPSAEETTRFVIDPESSKREKLVEHLLDDKQYGTNWARYWRDVILYRRSEDRALLVTAALEKFLTKSLNENQSWDQVATKFITAEGDVRENGATGVIMAQAGRPEETVAELSRIFMGIQIQCAQCHDHPTDRWKREQFHELAAFFPRVATRPRRDGNQRSFEVAAQDRFFNFRRQNANNRIRGTAEHHMKDLENPEAKGTLMKPVFFVTGESLPTGSTDDRRRESLARWMTDPSNPWFAKAMVNRMWAELVGEGFYPTVDDIGPDREPSAPKALEYLASEFAESGYDVKWLMQAITSTATYQQPSRSRRRYDEIPFQANCNQRMRGDQLFSALLTALGAPEPQARSFGRQAYGARFSPRNLFNIAFGYDPSDPRGEVKASIPQALLMMNSPMINGAINVNGRTDLAKLVREIKDDDQLITELYLRSYGRTPELKELKLCREHISSVEDRGEAFEDILWSLINSTEFQHRR